MKNPRLPIKGRLNKQPYSIKKEAKKILQWWRHEREGGWYDNKQPNPPEVDEWDEG